jgi:CBS domain-containing protein
VPGLDAEALAVRDVLTSSLSTVGEDESLFDALDLMRSRAVRRLPVVDADGALAGILTVDDVVGLLTEMLGRLSAVVERQRSREAQQRP